MNKIKGFTIIEVLIAVSILGMMLLLLMAFIFGLNFSNYKTKSDREVLENARRALDQITYEIKNAQSIYTPTTTQNQLSLQTTHYLPTGETTTFVDFFLCGAALCLKKESGAPIILTSDSVQISNLTFTQIKNTNFPSVRVSMTVDYRNPDAGSGHFASITLSSTASVRSY